MLYVLHQHSPFKMNQDINCAEYTRGGESFCSIVCILGGEIDEGLLNLKIRKQFGV